MSKRLPRGLTEEQGRYRVRFHSQHTRPKKVYRERLPEGTTRRQAETYLAKLREDDRLGQLLWPNEREIAYAPPPAQPSVGEFAAEVYLPYCETRNAPKTIRAKRQALQASAPWFWGVPLDEVTLDLVLRYQVERRAEGVRSRTVNMQWETIRHLLSHAHKRGFTPHPPPHVDPLPMRDKKPSRWLSEAEATRALEYAAQQQSGAMWYALTLFLLSTGARWGETRLLRWDDLDLDHAIVHLRAETAKHGKARDIPLLPELVDAIEALPQECEKVWMRRHFRTGEWIELKEDARILGGCYPWEGACRDLHVGPHVFRHTFATWRLQRGESLAIISEYLGHASQALTSDIYGHVKPLDRREAIENAPRPQVGRLRLVGRE